MKGEAMDSESAWRGGVWRIWIDTGGTFTDAVAVDPGGGVRRAKVLSTGALRATIARRLDGTRFEIERSWEAFDDAVRGMSIGPLGGGRGGEGGGSARIAGFDESGSVVTLESTAAWAREGVVVELGAGEEAPVLAARLLTGTLAGEPLPRVRMRLATTRGTNALLTRAGGPCALLVTEGFADLLRIGTQQRPDIFALEIRKRSPLPERVVEIPGRVSAAGETLGDLGESAVREAAAECVAGGVRGVAVALLHADRHPAHEERAAELLREAGVEFVSCSHELSAQIGLLGRATTACVDAYLAPVLTEYLGRVRSAMGGGRLHVMTSAGGLVDCGSFRAKDSLLSGPAGGVVGAARAAERSGFSRVISFDMGGTSTDVARYDGRVNYVYEHTVGDARLSAPAVAIETVAAGGGSVCSWERSALRVGPESAGADPGPACYGAGGPLTLTDVNLLLGRLDTSRFGVPVDEGAARAALESVLERAGVSAGESGALLEGFLRIAAERMAGAITRISAREGYEPGGYALVAFGGAGGQHACAVAARLGMRTVIVPRDAGLLSAVGLGGAVIERFAERQVLRPLEEVRGEVASWLGALSREAAARVAEEGIEAGDVAVRRRIAGLRLVGQESALDVEIDDVGGLERSFVDRYGEMYGHEPEGRDIELVWLRTVASSGGSGGDGEGVASSAASGRHRGEGSGARPVGRRRAYFAGRWRETPVFDRDSLPVGWRIEGPALIFEAHGATVVEPGWVVVVDDAGALVLERSGDEDGSDGRARAQRSNGGGHAEELVERELLISRVESIAREMGEALRRTAVSTNVKERLDFSCAVLDGGGELVVNAPHVPVHLGSMGLCVREVAGVVEMKPGDVVVTNHPGLGGSHLPDLTVISPVFAADGEVAAYVASRAHHAEIGGIAPGSMSARARTLEEEGVVVEPMHIVRGGRARYDEVRGVLRGARYPSRAVEDNIADLRAAVAANTSAASSLRALLKEKGAGGVADAMRSLKDRAEGLVRSAIRGIAGGEYRAEEVLDDGHVVRVCCRVAGDGMEVDFTGTSGAHPGNLNATPAIVRSAVVYVLRLLVREPLPLNEGLLRPVRIVLPRCMLNPGFGAGASGCPAVAGGNVETSQRVVDALLRALRLCAASQGTMNNVVFGNERISYYETVCGGSGAGPGFDGADAVHTHMTNTRITDPEVLEHRYPVRLERFSVRRGSGGAGAHRGGDGAVRCIAFLEEMELSVLTQRRARGAPGMEGGGDGKPGAQAIERAGGAVERLGAIDSAAVRPGDRLILETPGGGGWGSAEP